MKTLRQADLAVGAFIALLGAGTGIAATGIKGVAGESLDPRTLPFIIAWFLAALGLGMVVVGFRYNGPPIPLSWPDRAGVRRLVVTLITMVFYLFMLDTLGFPLSTGLFVTILMWYLGRYRPWAPIATGLLMGAVVYFVFMELLGLNLPMGFLY